MNRVQRSSPGTYQRMESTAPKVLSRYLRGPTGSCHDHCKCVTTQTTETKPIHYSVHKRAPKAPAADRTIVDAAHSVHRIKKVPSVVPKATTHIVKNNKVSPKKGVTSEPKSREVKPKSQNSQIKTRYLSSSRTHRRRNSEIFLPNKDHMLLPLRVPNRRLSEIFASPNRDIRSVSNASLVRGSSISKNGSRKDSKPSSVNKKSNSLKTIVPSPKTGAKVPTLRSHRSVPKPELKGSRKPKPVKAIEEVVPEKTLHVIEPNNGTVETTKSRTPILSASSSSSSEEKVVQECSPSKGDDTPATEGQHNDNVADSEDKDTKEATRVGKLVVETKDDHSPGELRFRRGKVLSPESESSSPRKVEFRQGKVLDEEQSGKGENRSLRRLSSDGVVHTPESPSVNVELKHQDMVEKKEPSGLFNKIIEETASELIRTRKSKVKALVGAFENISSAQTP